MALAAAGVVAVVAVALLAVTALRHRAVAPPLVAASTPVATSSPTSSASPSPTPSETPTPTPTSVATVEPGLPPYHQLTADVLARAGVGWVVGAYDPVSDVDGVYPRVLVISPDGTVYRAADPKVNHDSQMGWYLRPVRWAPGSHQVVVEFGQGDSTDRVLLDLLTGDLVPDGLGRPETSDFAGLAADGSEVWSPVYAGGLWVIPPTGRARQVVAPSESVHASRSEALDPSGRYVALRRSKDDGQSDIQVLDLSTGRLTPPLMAAPAGQTCDFAGWADPARALVICAHLSDPTPAVSAFTLAASAITFDVSGTTPTRVSIHDYAATEVRPALGPTFPAMLSWVGHDRLLAGAASSVAGADRCTLKAAWFDSEGRALASQEPVPTGPAGQVTAAGGTAYIAELPGCPGGSGLVGLTSVDPAGRTTTLIPHTSADQAGTFEWAVAH